MCKDTIQILERLFSPKLRKTQRILGKFPVVEGTLWECKRRDKKKPGLFRFLGKFYWWLLSRLLKLGFLLEWLTGIWESRFLILASRNILDSFYCSSACTFQKGSKRIRWRKTVFRILFQRCFETDVFIHRGIAVEMEIPCIASSLIRLLPGVFLSI